MSKLHTRAEAGLRAPKYRNYISLPTPRLWLHHTAGSQDEGGNGWYDDDIRSIQNFHMGPQRGWSDIAYSFLADSKGECWTGRGAGVAGGHTKGDNSKSHAICAIGNYEVYEPKPAMLEGIAWLTAHGWLAGWWSTFITGPHRDAPGAATSCCGKHLIAKIPFLNDRAAQIIFQLVNPSSAPKNQEDETMIAEMIKAMYALARRTDKKPDYDVLAEDPGGYLHNLNKAYRSGDPLAFVNSSLRAALEKESGRKLPSL
jgi:hypothetical protein